MKKIFIIPALLLTICAFSRCNTGAGSKPGVDSAGNYTATNPYRDTFATTNSYGEATNTDNSGSGGTMITKSHSAAPVTVQADSSKDATQDITKK
jgi:cytochrome oxidase Cu insertion factor (SCO1/SenC/PrrC family)